MIGDGCDWVQIEHKLIGFEFSGLIVKHTFAKEAASREEDFVVKTA